MKKIIIFTFLCILLTGCTANYKININNNLIEENLTIIETDKSKFDIKNNNGFSIRESFDSLLEEDEFSNETYNIKSINSDDAIGIEYNSNILKSLDNSSIIYQCYKEPSIIINENIVTIDTGSNFECFDLYDNLENVEISLNTNNKVLTNNADNVIDNKYVWNITKLGNKQIKFSYEINNMNNLEDNQEENNTNNLDNINNNEENNENNKKINIYYIITTIVLILLIVVLIIYVKIKKANVI